VSRRSGQTTLGSALGGYIRRIDRGGGLTQASVIEAWPEAVGPDIARHTAGLHVREGELIVYVDSPVWATELTALSAQLVKSLNEHLGQDLVRAMRFSVSRKVETQRNLEAQEQEDASFYSRDRVESVPLSEAEIEQIRQSASAIRKPALRDAVVRATVKDLEWKRGLEQRDAEQGA
jgi:predicted nucleic acid-binding Zn ribbon protein